MPKRLLAESRFSRTWMVAGTLVCSVLVAGAYSYDRTNRERRMRGAEQARVQAFEQMLSLDYTHWLTELLVFADNVAVKDYVETRSSDALRGLKSAAEVRAKIDPMVDQIRLLDARGHEVLRVNHGGRLVADDLLQDKSDRSYFQRARELAPGEVYLSRVDLNVENGAIEVPLKPVIRLATAVHDGQGALQVVAVINVRMEDTLAGIDRMAPGEGAVFEMFNADGYWLRSAKANLAWGFMWPEGRNLTLANREPKIWQAMQAGASGEALGRQDHYAWRWVNLAEAAANRLLVRVQAEQDRYLLVSVVPRAEWLSTAGARRPWFWLIWVLAEIGLILAGVTVAERRIQRRRVEDALREAARAAEESSRFKSRFLANMSHEIRTPLNGVIGMTDLLLDSGLKAEQKELVRTISNSGDLLLTLINDILDLSKIEAGMITLESRSFDLRDAVEHVVTILASKAQERRNELVWVVEPEVPERVVGDVQRFQQILINLVGNAVKFTAEGEITTRVTLARAVDELGSLRLHVSVADTGIGISPEVQSKLFRPFVQADASVTRRFGGTGLGLTISREFIERMGGEIRMESEVGVGTTFHFEIEMGHDSSPTPVVVEPVLEHRRALVVDDNATNREIYRRQLEHWGMEVMTADSGAEALTLLDRCKGQEEWPDLAVVDVMMPHMSGEALVREIRIRFREHRLGIIMASSAQGSLTSAALDALHVEALVQKPVRRELLRKTMLGYFANLGKVATPHSHSPFGDPVKLVGLRLLIADDDLSNRLVLSRMVTRLGGEVDLATDGAEAWRRLQENDYPIVLMDCQMPGMSGFDVVRKLRGRETYRSRHRSYVVAVTAGARSEDREACDRAGMDDYLTKPIRIDDLNEAMVRALDQLREHAVEQKPTES